MPPSHSALLTPVLDWKMMSVANLSMPSLSCSSYSCVSPRVICSAKISSLFVLFFGLVSNLHRSLNFVSANLHKSNVSEFCLPKPAQIQGISILSPKTCTNPSYLNSVSPNLHKPKIRILSPRRNPASELRFFSSSSCKWVPSKMECSCLSAKEHRTEKCRKMVAFTSASPHCGANVWIQVKEHKATCPFKEKSTLVCSFKVLYLFCWYLPVFILLIPSYNWSTFEKVSHF